MALTPAQQAAADGLLGALGAGSVYVLRGNAGAGKTTVLKHISKRSGGALLGVRNFIDTLMLRGGGAVEEAFAEMIEAPMAAHEIVLLDDLHLITAITSNYDYPRAGLLDAIIEMIASAAVAQRRQLIFAINRNDPPWPIRNRAYSWDIADYGPADYRAVCSAYLQPEAEARLDYSRIHRFAPGLNAHQLKNACVRLAGGNALTTDSFIEYLSSVNMTSNVAIEEVQPVTWNDLKGLDDVIEALEAKIALPFENAALAAELDLKPKRGVLLAGPPGTGKTTIGRALAHRLKGKFFLIDGTVVAESSDFYDTLRGIFARARRNAPSVVFIDDTDLIFGNDNRGFYRYLLTLLDGLESASAERICVMMTAMEVSAIPAALLRSGRVELWLETRLPGAEARVAIFRDRLAKLTEPVRSVDIERLAAASRNLTGADLKAVVEDGKLLFAYDKASERPLRPVEEYFLEAIETVRANRRSYARKKSPALTEPVPFGFAG